MLQQAYDQIDSADGTDTFQSHISQKNLCGSRPGDGSFDLHLNRLIMSIETNVTYSALSEYSYIGVLGANHAKWWTGWY